MTSFYEELHKSEKYSDEKENAQSRATIDKWIFRLLLFLIGFMPLVVMANVEEVISPLVSNIDVLASGTKGDLFTHYKTVLVLLITVITGAMLLVKVLFMDGTIRKTFLNYVLGVFVVAIVVSTIASPNISIALNGQYNRSDGAISWLCYLALMFIAMNIEYPKKVISYIMYTIMPFVFINLYIITMNFYGKDLLVNNAWMQSFVSIMLPEGANISEGSILVGTLNQWNYMSGMFSIMTVLYLMAAVLEKNKLSSYSYLLFSLMSFAILLMSISTSGFLTMLVLLPIIISAILKSHNKIKSILIFTTFLICCLPIFHVLASKEARVWTESIGFIIKSNPYEEQKVEVTMHEKPPAIRILNRVHATERFELPELPTRQTGAASGRVYIWGKSIELAKDRPLFGYGMDTLIYNFPHTNIETRANFWYDNIITDKPHSLYVGWLYGTGIIGFLSAIALILFSVIRSLKDIYIRNQAAVWILGAGWGAYLVQGFFNDSLPSISAPLWILAGIMMAITFTSKELTDGRNN